MKVLIIEDTESKARSVQDVISHDRSGVDTHFEFADDLSSAIRASVSTAFDLIILDIMLPYIKGGEAVTGAGLELLRQFRSLDGKNKNSVIVGLSAYPEEMTSAKDSFDKFGVILLEYDEADRWKQTVARITDDVISRDRQDDPLDFLIVVALPEEKSGYDQTSLNMGHQSIREGLNVTFVDLLLDVPRRGAIVLQRQMGLISATFDTATAIATFRPKVVCMSGICAGMADKSELGQLILPSPTWEYQAGKWAQDDFLIAPHQVQIRPATKVIAEQVFARTCFEELERDIPLSVPRPKLREIPVVAPGATGSAVVASSEKLDHIVKQHRKLAVIDMEVHGVYSAVHENAVYVPHYFAVKCVVDHADSAKGDDLHAYGSIVSARMTIQLLSALFSADA